MPNAIVEMIRRLSPSLRRTLVAYLHAARNYIAPTDRDVARDVSRSTRTIRRHRQLLARQGLPVRALCRGRPRIRCHAPGHNPIESRDAA